ncbi:MAG: hypothetical protein HN353_12620 [Bdellovibrionales bacterium]|jgi:hypothetical protein|nr:hypothetical protein [Bdellovibrionales bacterium]MBT3526360.1 hypothetical protein [Bdellovibrionales bacterium]MBT7765619.1 hypothetical protein [Bdellovibrionales bacterium]
MKSLLLSLLISTLFLASTSGSACPSLDHSDLANGDGPWNYIELERYSVTLTEAEFLQVPVYVDFDYNECKNSLVIQKVQSKESGRIFSALLTVEDNCDGGNSYGALYSENRQAILGDIRDSFIYCQ